MSTSRVRGVIWTLVLCCSAWSGCSSGDAPAPGGVAGGTAANGSAGGTGSGAGDTADAAAPGVILLRYTPGSESTHQREEGFLEAIKSHPELNVLSSDQFAGTTPEESLNKAQQVLQKFGPRTNGLFAVCEPNANGVLGALEELGLAGKIKFVGFDPNERMVQAMSQGKMHGIVLQDPVTMGELSVKAMLAHLAPDQIRAEDRERLFDGEKVRKRIPTGEYLATPENMQDEQMVRLLHPPQATGDEKGPASPKFRIAVIPKGTTHEFWKSVHYGALKAAQEAGNVEILWQGPPLESDRAEQIKLVQNFITKKVHGIVLAPLDSRALVEVVHEAQTNGIPTVIFDSGLEAKEDAYVSYVATDNFGGGKLAGERLAELLAKPK